MDRGAWWATVHGIAESDRSQRLTYTHTRAHTHTHTHTQIGFPHASDSKESVCNAGDLGWILGSQKSSGEGNGYPPLYTSLETFMDREACRATVHGAAESDTVG